MIEKYVGREQWEEFLEVVQEALKRDGTLSPGGAASLLRISRQRVYTIVETHPEIHSWAFYEDSKKRYAQVFEINVRDLLRWGVCVGRIRSSEDLGLPWGRIVKMYDEVCAEVASGALQLAPDP